MGENHVVDLVDGQAETKAPNMLEQALDILDKPSKFRSSSYQMILLRAGAYT